MRSHSASLQMTEQEQAFKDNNKRLAFGFPKGRGEEGNEDSPKGSGQGLPHEHRRTRTKKYIAVEKRSEITSTNLTIFFLGLLFFLSCVMTIVSADLDYHSLFLSAEFKPARGKTA